MLKTDYKDDRLNTDFNENRKFNIVRSDGTLVGHNVELRETTVFEQLGDSFGAKDINATNTAINDVTSKLQNLQIGGRNLIKDSKGEVILRNSSLTEISYSYIISNEEGLIGDNTTIMLSADIKTNGHVTSIDFYLFDKNIKNISVKTFENLPTTYTRMSATFTIQPSQTGTDWSSPLIRIDNNGTDSEGTEALLYVRNPKLEIGNIATDWTPAPEDLETTSITNSDIDTILNS